MNKRSEDNKAEQVVSKGEEKKDEEKSSENWTDEEIKLLVKGCKLIAVGTRNR